MKPGFALSLSFDGISLLHRAAGGWRRVGEVALDAPDLAGELASLRELAERLEPGGLSCKLIIPNDQIRYLSLGTGSVDDESLDEQVRAALEGATPYAVENLAYDISRHDETTHVAAVARETLDEAETFATDHDFNPVSFVAVPGDQPFLGEPFFGPARCAAELDVVPDGVAVVVIGEAVVPPLAKEPEPEPVSEPVSAPSVPDPVAGQGNQGFSTRRSKSYEPETAPPSPLPQTEPDPLPEAEPAPVIEAVAIAGPTIAVEPDAPPPPLPVNADTPARTPEPPLVAVRSTPESKPRTSPIESDFDPEDETSRMTVFGARPNGEVGGKPRYLGLVLTTGLVVCLLAVAVWATVFSDLRLFDTSSDVPMQGEERTVREIESERTDPEPGLSPEPEQTSQPEPELSSAAPAIAPEPPVQPEAETGGIDTARIDPLYSPEVATADPIEDEQSADEALQQGDLEATPLPKAPTQVLEPLTEPARPELDQAPSEETEPTALDPGITEEPAPVAAEPGSPALPAQPLDDAALYAATGIWPNAPVQPGTPAVIGLTDLYTASIDRTDLFQDAVALPAEAGLKTDSPVPEVISPVAPDNAFTLDSRGLVEPSAEGTLNPDGILVFEGRPTKVPPDTLPRKEEADLETDVARARLAGLRPKLRPDDLIEKNERAQFGGRSLAELAKVRPRLRPAGLVRPEEPEEERGPPTAQAVASSVKPKLRPAGLVSKVNKERLAAASTASIQDVTSAQPVVLAPRTVSPKIPSSASVARQATVKNTINLRKVNLIGVYGSPSNRRALVRLPSGRYKKVKIGDSVDGGRVVAIGDSELRYQKAGRNVTLKMPKS